MKMFLIYIVLGVATGVDVKINTTIPPFYKFEECKNYVIKNSINILNSARSTFIYAKVLEMGCVEMKQDGRKFSPLSKEDTSI